MKNGGQKEEDTRVSVCFWLLSCSAGLGQPCGGLEQGRMHFAEHKHQEKKRLLQTGIKD